MTITNHVLAGSLIALTIKQPALALPLAFASHFVLDAIPHFGYPGRKGYSEMLKHKLTYVVQALDVIGVVFLIAVFGFSNWIVAVAVFLAILPDLEWPYRYYFFERKGLAPPSVPFLTEFHRKLQWCERPWAVTLEIVFFVLGYYLLTNHMS